MEQGTNLKSEQQVGQVKLHRIYTKSSIFEAAPMELSFLENPLLPESETQYYVTIIPKEKKAHEAILTAHVTTKHQGKLLWRVQIQQAGFYTLEGFSEVQENQILNGYCMNQLFPYLATVLTNLIVQGSFAPIYLPPVNFDRLYETEQQKSRPEEKVATT